jgi:adenylyltransferase/sulfurtransferase
MKNSMEAEPDANERIRKLELRIAQLEQENRELRASDQHRNETASKEVLSPPEGPLKVLSKDQIERYSRQLLLNEGFGVAGQLKLLSSSVLVVGAGGIGSTALLYLAASGIGKIAVIDFDGVETSNLHRQVIHKARNVGRNKAISACQSVLDLNPTIQCEALSEALTHENALEIIKTYDCIVDASDNPRTRYLINDACVLANKPLISGSAVGVEAQLTVYNWKDGPCYRCLYPKAEASAGCKACSDAGVLGPVPGLIGILQSMETIKVLTGVGATMHNRLLMYDALQCSFFSVKKPAKSPKCPVCGPQATIRTMQDSSANLRDARGPTGVVDDGKIVIPQQSATSLPDGVEISCAEYAQIRMQGLAHVLLDVRVTKQYEMCALDGAVNIPLARIPEELARIEELSDGTKPVYCVCRRGIASKEAARILLDATKESPRIHSIYHIEGGLTAWHNQVDSSFPKY